MKKNAFEKKQGSKLLLTAVLLSNLVFGANQAQADSTDTSVSDYGGLKSAIFSKTLPESTSILLNNDITDFLSTLKLTNHESTINGMGYGIVSNTQGKLGFDIQVDSKLSLKNLTLKNFDNGGWGSAVYNEGVLFINNVNFENNINKNGKVSGAAIANFGFGDANISGNNVFRNNKSENFVGGAIYNDADMRIMTEGADRMIFDQNSANKLGGAIYNDGTMSLYGNYEFTDNSANSGGAIYNDGVMSIEGNYLFKNNSAAVKGGAIVDELGRLNIVGTRDSAGDASIVFDGNKLTDINRETRGGAIYMIGKNTSEHSSLTIKNVDFLNNSATTHGGAIYIDVHTSFNIDNVRFINNSVTGSNLYNLGWGGALGLDSQATSVYGHVENSYFEGNYAEDSGGAIPSGTYITIANSKFFNNNAKLSAGALSYNPDGDLFIIKGREKTFKLIADGEDTVIAGNWVGDQSSTRTASNSEGLYFGNAIADENGQPIVGDDGNDSSIYLNAGNSGNIVINDIVNALGNAYDDRREVAIGQRLDINNPNIQLNKSNVQYAEITPNISHDDILTAPTDGMIIFNNQVQGANLVLHNGTLAFGKANTYSGYLTPEKYFDDTAKITLKGGTLDLINGNVETRRNNDGSIVSGALGIFNPASVTVLGDANLRFDIKLFGDGTVLDGNVDYINSDIVGNKKLTIDKIEFYEDGSTLGVDLGQSKLFQFTRSNSVETEIVRSLQNVITSYAGYTLELGRTNTDNDSILVTKFLDNGGLPVAVSLGQDNLRSVTHRTYVYNATSDEEITDSSGSNSWNKGYNIYLDGATQHRETSNVLKGELLQINGNNQNVFTTAGLLGIELGVENSLQQQLIVNDVRKADGSGWKGFNSAIINKGGIVTLNNSVFAQNASFDDGAGKVGNGGAVFNQSGTLNINDSDFIGNSASAMGGAIYNGTNGVVNMLATDDGRIKFENNSATKGNDVYNEGTLNLAATSNSSIIFNSGIDGNNGNINIGFGSNQNVGSVIFNNTIANQNVYLNSGVLQIGQNASVARTDYFNNVNLNLNGGSLNLANNYIDTISVNDFNIGTSSPQLMLDLNLNSEQSDNFVVSGNVNQDGVLYIGPVNIVEGLGSGQTSAVITYIDKAVNADIDVVNRYITINGVSYEIDVVSNKLFIHEQGRSGGYAYEVISTERADRTFSIGSDDELVPTWIGGDNKLAGMRFQVLGGIAKKKLIGYNLPGIIVSTYNGSRQQLDVNSVSSYQGFDTAFVNDGGLIIFQNSKFESNNSTSNGGVVRNLVGELLVRANTIFENNSASNLGGAIYNAFGAVVNMITENGKNILFNGNTASSGNDIYNAGTINISGKGEVLINGGIAGTINSVINNDGSKLVLNGDNSNYKGDFNLTSGTVEVNDKFFSGSSVISGTMNWLTNNDISYEAKLVIDDGAVLNVGNGVDAANLTIQGTSYIDNAGAVNINDNANLTIARKTTVKNIGGNGTLTLNASELNFNSNSSSLGNLKFVSKNNSTVTLDNISDIQKASSIAQTVQNGTNRGLTLIFDNTGVSTNLTIDSSAIATVLTKNNVALSNLTLSDNGGVLQNTGHLNLLGTITTGNGVIINKGTSSELDLNARLTGHGTLTNEGTLNVLNDQSFFTGTFTQTSGVTNVSRSDNLFYGTKNIKGGTLNINAGDVNYSGIKLGNGASLNHAISEVTSAGVDSSAFEFTGEGANAVFDGVGLVEVVLDKVDNGQENTISVKNGKLTLAASDYTGKTIYDVKNSTLNLINTSTENTVSDYVFDKLKTDNSKLDFKVVIKRNDVKGNSLITDTVKASNNGLPMQKFDIGNIYISGEENGQRGSYNTVKDVLQGGLEFNPDTTISITGATTSWIYDISLNGNKTIKMDINNYSNNNTLFEMNELSGTRFFQFTEGDTRDYNISKSLSALTSGTFNVVGTAVGEIKNVISGKIADISGVLTGNRGNLFNTAGTHKTELNIKNIQMSDAYTDGSGSVILNYNPNAVIKIVDSKIINNDASGNGGAIYNGVKPTDVNVSNIVISNTVFENNSAVGLGGAIYNEGNILLDNVKFVAGIESAANDIYQGDGGLIIFSGVSEVNSDISGVVTSVVKNEGILSLSGDNSEFKGDFIQNSASGKTILNGGNFFGGNSVIANGTLTLLSDVTDLNGGKLTVTGGNVIIGSDTVNAKLNLDNGSRIDSVANLYITNNSELNVKENGIANIDTSDFWLGTVGLDGGTLNVNNINNYQGAIFKADNGVLNLDSGILLVGNNSYINKTVDTNIEAGATLGITDGGSVSLADNSRWKGEIALNGGELIVNNLSVNGALNAVSGNLNIESGILTLASGSSVEDAVKVNILSDGKVNIKGGTLTIYANDNWQGIINLGLDGKGGVLNYGTQNSGTLFAMSGKLNLLENSVLNIQNPSQIEKDVEVDIQSGATVNINDGAQFNLDENDKWAGTVTVNENGLLITSGVNNSVSGGTLEQNGGKTILTDNSNIYINGASFINGGEVAIIGGSVLHLGSGVPFNADTLSMGGNSLFNAVNNSIDIVNAGNMYVSGTNNFSVDLNFAEKSSDIFKIENLLGNGVLNVSDFRFIGDSPVEKNVKFTVFDVENNTENVEFSTTDNEVTTPIGIYKMASEGNGVYSAVMEDINKQVYRGQVATLAMYNQQLLIDDMMTNHFILSNEKLIDQMAMANRSASNSSLYSPYQSTVKDGDIWFKPYASFETLSMNNGISVENNTYGSLIGVDVPAIHLDGGWDLIQTLYIGYNGGNQRYENTKLYQNGGQAGIMHTYTKKNFTGSIMGYAGGYANEMSLAGTTDQSGNWFAGTSAKVAYNINATKNFKIQPTGFVAYNHFGKQKWNTDYGYMTMKSGSLNGINLAPGVNFIYSKNTWSVYGTLQYMFNLNDRVKGKAGVNDLASTQMRHGYVTYGIGATKMIKDRGNAYVQVNMRNGGRTGIGFQFGVNFFVGSTPNNEPLYKGNNNYVLSMKRKRKYKKAV